MENLVTNWQGWKWKYRKRKYNSAGVVNVSTETGRAILTHIWRKNITANIRNTCRYRCGKIRRPKRKANLMNDSTCVFHPCDFVLAFSVRAFSIPTKCHVLHLHFPYLRLPILAISAPRIFECTISVWWKRKTPRLLIKYAIKLLTSHTSTNAISVYIHCTQAHCQGIRT